MASLRKIFKGAVTGIEHAIGSTGTAIGNEAKLGVANLTHNPQAAQDARNRITNSGAAQVATSVGAPLVHIAQAGYVNPIRAGIAAATHNVGAQESLYRQQKALTNPHKFIADAGQSLLTVGTGGVGRGLEALGVKFAPKVLRSVTPQLVKRGLTNTGTGAVVGGPYNVLASVGNGDKQNVKSIAKEFKTGAVGGAALGLGSVAAPAIAKGVIKGVPKIPQGIKTVNNSATKARAGMTAEADSYAKNHPSTIAGQDSIKAQRVRYEKTTDPLAKQQISKSIAQNQQDLNKSMNKLRSDYTKGEHGHAAVGGPLIPVPKKLITKNNSEIAPPDVPIKAPTPNPNIRTTRYASKTIPNSPVVSKDIGAITKENAPTYVKGNEKQRYYNSLSRVKNEGLKNVSDNVYEKLKSGKVDAQTVTEGQTVAALHDAARTTGDIQRAADIYDLLSKHFTDAGKTVQAAAIMSRMSPEGLMLSGTRQLNKAGVKITPEIHSQLAQAVDKVKTTKLGSKQREYEIQKFRKTVTNNVPTEFVDKLTSFWKAGLLTGAKTSTGNILSNTTFGVLHGVSDPVAVGLDRAVGLFTGERTKTLTQRGRVSGTISGTKKGGAYLKTGVDELNDVNKYEHQGINFKNKVLNTYVNGVFRVMGAADKPFRYAQMMNSLADMAKADGLNKGLSGKALKTHIAGYIDNPPYEAAQTALNEGAKAVLGQDTALATAITNAKKGIEKMPPSVGRTVLKLAINGLAPFVKVPSAFVSRVVDFTPVGALKEVGNQVARKQFDQRGLATAISEAGTGTGLIWLGSQLANNGLLSGNYPTDPKEAQRWKADGIQPNSVKVDGKWLSLNYLGPVGLLFNAGKRVNDTSGEGLGSQAIASATGTPKDIMGQSFLQGFSGFSSAVNDPQRSAKTYINSQIASGIPSIVNDIANATDNMQREANNPKQAVQAKIPGLRQGLPVKQDVYGNDLAQKSGPASLIANPLRPSNVITNPVKTEVDRLHNVDVNNKDLQITPTPINKALVVGGAKVLLQDSQRHDLQKLTGQSVQSAWKDIINSSEYKNLNDVQKSNALNKARQDVTSIAQSEYLAKNQLGPYSPSYTGKDAPLTKRLAGIANSGIKTTDYTIPKSANEVPKNITDAIKAVQTKSSNPTNVSFTPLESKLRGLSAANLQTLVSNGTISQQTVDGLNTKNSQVKAARATTAVKRGRKTAVRSPRIARAKRVKIPKISTKAIKAPKIRKPKLKTAHLPKLKRLKVV